MKERYKAGMLLVLWSCVVWGGGGEGVYRMRVVSRRDAVIIGMKGRTSFEYEWDFVASAKEVEGGVRVKGRTKRFELKALEMKVPFWGGGGGGEKGSRKEEVEKYIAGKMKEFDVVVGRDDGRVREMGEKRGRREFSVVEESMKWMCLRAVVLPMELEKAGWVKEGFGRGKLRPPAGRCYAMRYMKKGEGYVGYESFSGKSEGDRVEVKKKLWMKVKGGMLKEMVFEMDWSKEGGKDMVRRKERLWVNVEKGSKFPPEAERFFEEKGKKR